MTPSESRNGSRGKAGGPKAGKGPKAAKAGKSGGAGKALKAAKAAKSGGPKAGKGPKAAKAGKSGGAGKAPKAAKGAKVGKAPTKAGKPTKEAKPQHPSIEQRVLSLLKQAPGISMPFKTLEGILGMHSGKDRVRLRKAVRSLRDQHPISETAQGAIRLGGSGRSAQNIIIVEDANHMKSSKKNARRETGKGKSKRAANASGSKPRGSGDSPSSPKSWETGFRTERAAKKERGESKRSRDKGVKARGANKSEGASKRGGKGFDGERNRFRSQTPGGGSRSQSRLAGSDLTGVLDVTSRGDGYVAIEGLEQDVMIPQSQMGTAMQGDTVRIRLTGVDRRRGRDMGAITEILERSNRLLVGRILEPSPGTFVIEPDLRSGSVDFLVPTEDLNGAVPGDKVSFRLKEWAHPKGLPVARSITVLGRAGTSQAEILGILAENQFQSGFPEEVEAFAERIPDTIPEEVIARRLDLRHMNIFTIDPADAKDFDDALSIEILDNGNYHLGVHIADVTHYMPRGSALDQEAFNRATSVYLVDRVIPMLPERLSNGVCSLRPHEDKCCYSCFMELTADGRLVDYSIRETVIHSKQRFVYDEVQEILDGKDHVLKPELTLLETLTKKLMGDRFNAGAIAFETPEPRFVLDKDGTPIRVIVKERLFAHKLIEECMLMANKTVALHIETLRRGNGAAGGAKKGAKKGAKAGGYVSADTRGSGKAGGHTTDRSSASTYPFFYRIHDRPDAQKLENVLENVKPLGISFKVHAQGMSSGQINDLLKQVEGTSLETIVNGLVLRSMAKAEYSPKNIGHFGLAFPHYAHFTSPIRRYPDVIVHRLLKSYHQGTMEYTFDELVSSGEHCSAQERNAVDAERDSVKLKQVEFLSSRLGQDFDAVIAGVTEHGFYAQIVDIYCEGMVRMSELRDDYYTFHPERHALIGKGKNRQFRLGDSVRVRVLRTDTERRQIDLGLA